jgi:peroxiredoxin
MVKILDDLARLGRLAERFVEIRSEPAMETIVASPFSLEALDGRRVTLEAHRGRRVLLAFLRNAQCAVCNLWVHTTEKHAAAWRQDGLDVIAVFESSAERLKGQFAEWKPSFAVLADPDGAVHDAYGSRTDPARVQQVVESGIAHEALARANAAGFPTIREEGSNFFRLPAEILVDEAGMIAMSHVAEDVGNHLPDEVITAFARRSR